MRVGNFIIQLTCNLQCPNWTVQLKRDWTVTQDLSRQKLRTPTRSGSDQITRPLRVLLTPLLDFNQNQQQEQISSKTNDKSHSGTSMGESLISLDRATVLLPILLLCLACYICVVPVTEAIWLQIPSSGTKCVSEEINSNVVVLADYYVIDEAHPEHPPTVSAKVTSPYGNNLHHNENVTHGQFAFTTTEAGNYMACFWLESNPQKVADATLGLDWRIGFSAKDWESVAKKDKIEGVELHLKRLEAQVQSIHENLLFLKHREAEMREVSEATNSRVAWLSILSLGVCIAVSSLQLWYLTRYFQKKKLI